MLTPKEYDDIMVARRAGAEPPVPPEQCRSGRLAFWWALIATRDDRPLLFWTGVAALLFLVARGTVAAIAWLLT